MTKYINYIIISLFALLAGSCVDDTQFYMEELGDGETNLHITVAFDAETGADVNTRVAAPGNSIQDIKSFWVVIFNEDKSLLAKYPVYGTGQALPAEISNVSYGRGDNRDDSEKGGNYQDSSSGKLKFDLSLWSGRYYIYGVANVANFGTQAISSPDDLKSIQCQWDETSIANNSEMFGIFSLEPNRNASDATAIPVSVRTTSIHCWLRRLASKVTVSFDGSELFDNVQIFIDKVRLVDVPKQCSLGFDNTPGKNLTTGNYAEVSARYTVANGLVKDGGVIEYQKLPAAPYTSLLPDNYLHVCNDEHWKYGKVDASADYKAPGHGYDTMSLFFYENMQGKGAEEKEKWQDADGDGVVDNPNWIDGDPDSDWKDKKPYGTYVEVTGLYRNTQAFGTQEVGPITYRFMLGQDAKSDFNCRRNTHYRVTMKFKGSGKDPDWHIEYDEGAGIYTTSPQYVSYLYNKQTYITVKVVGELKAGSKLKATIVDEDNKMSYISKGLPVDMNQTYWQPWGNESERFNDPADWVSEAEYGSRKYTLPLQIGDDKLHKDTRGPWNGFLSLKQINVVKVENPKYAGASSNKGDVVEALQYNRNYYYGKEAFPGNRHLGMREFNIEESTGTNDGDGNYTCTITRKISVGGVEVPVERVFRIPLFVRAKELVTRTGFVGNNPYFSYHRREQVVFESELANGQKQYYVLDVIQVPRIINPTAIWRDKNTEPFHVRLMMEEEPFNAAFKSFTSDGAWSAEVVVGEGSGDIITLSSTVAGSGDSKAQNRVARIVGETERPIDFNINFTGAEGVAGVKIRYNNFTCEHDIYVRKGSYSGTVQLLDGGVRWSLCNIDHFDGNKAVHCTSPLDEGSLFRRGSTTAILSENNTSENLFKAPSKLKVRKSDGSVSDVSWAACAAPTNSSNINSWSIGGTSERIAKIEDWYTLTDYENSTTTAFPIKKDYGVIYGDGTNETRSGRMEAFGYSSEHTDYGMRGIIVYNRKTLQHIFLPIGKSGVGRRKGLGGWQPELKDAAGTLRYAGRTVYNEAATTQPLFYDIFRRYGAIYWCRNRRNDIEEVINAYGVEYEKVDQSCAMDFNFFTMGFEGFLNGAAALNDGSDSDACFIRTVHY